MSRGRRELTFETFDQENELTERPRYPKIKISNNDFLTKILVLIINNKLVQLWTLVGIVSVGLVKHEI
jgi:hypothetical protein